MPVTFARMWCHNVDGIMHVLDIIRFRPMSPGLLRADHPWVTGIPPGDDRPIWWRNVIFRSPRGVPGRSGRPDFPEDDEVIVRRFRELGYLFVTLDLQGFRSGSANEALRWIVKP